MRDRDVRNALQTALMATNAFDAVWVSGLPEASGRPSSQLRAAAIEPDSTSYQPMWDSGPASGMLATSTCKVTLLARDDDPQTRDESAEMLEGILRNTVNGQQLSGESLVLPQKSYIVSSRFQPAEPPERRVLAMYSYQYLLPGWDEADVSP